MTALLLFAFFLSPVLSQAPAPSIKLADDSTFCEQFPQAPWCKDKRS